MWRMVLKWLYGTKYSRMDQLKFLGDSFQKIWRDMLCLSRSYLSKCFEGYLPQVLLGLFLNTLTHFLCSFLRRSPLKYLRKKLLISAKPNIFMLHKSTTCKGRHEVIIFWHGVIVQKMVRRFSCTSDISPWLKFGRFNRTIVMQKYILWGFDKKNTFFQELAVELEFGTSSNPKNLSNR